MATVKERIIAEQYISIGKKMLNFTDRELYVFCKTILDSMETMNEKISYENIGSDKKVNLRTTPSH